MQLETYFLLVCMVFQFTYVLGDESTLCKTWNKIPENLRNEQFHMECNTSDDCYSFSCSGTSYGYDVNSRIQLYACENPPSIEFEVNIPKLNVNNMKRRIYHNDSVTLTRNLNVEFEVTRSNQNLILGVFIKFMANGSLPLLHNPLRIPVISSIPFHIDCLVAEETTQHSLSVGKSISTVSSQTTKSFLVFTKSMDDSYSNCSVRNSSCGEDEVCQQIEKLKPDGICVCQLNYTRNIDGKCIHGQKTPKAWSVSLLLTATLVPSFVILLILVAMYATVRFRIFQHLRRRLRVQVYEHVLLGEDEDEEDGADPVA